MVLKALARLPLYRRCSPTLNTPLSTLVDASLSSPSGDTTNSLSSFVHKWLVRTSSLSRRNKNRGAEASNDENKFEKNNPTHYERCTCRRSHKRVDGCSPRPTKASHRHIHLTSRTSHGLCHRKWGCRGRQPFGELVDPT